MKEYIIQKLQEYIELLAPIDNFDTFDNIRDRISIFLLNTFSKEIKEEFDILTIEPNFILGNWRSKRQVAIGYLESLIAIGINNETKSLVANSVLNDDIILKKSNMIFIVHGKDNELKETVARFVQNIGLEPIILHEQANSSNTIIEKLEKYSNVSFAIVLLTPDDWGGISSEKKILNKRARQNVILELGYFIGKLGRSNVCALKKDEIELPSDYHGILYINVDSEGAWKTKLAQEIVESGIKINLDGIIKK